MHKEFDKLPRIYVEADLGPSITIDLSPPQAHYLKNVLRRQEGDDIRIFNARHGEWSASLQNIKKKSGEAVCQKQLKQQPQQATKTHLFFAPIKKSRMDILIEKSVELGVTDLHPTITERTQFPKINIERLQAQNTEAAEQCERMDIPALHAPIKLNALKHEGTIFAAIERGDHPFIGTTKLPKNPAFLIGPVGGFTDEEITFLLKHNSIKPISLGARIYRAETAAILCLSHAALN